MKEDRKVGFFSYQFQNKKININKTKRSKYLFQNREKNLKI